MTRGKRVVKRGIASDVILNGGEAGLRDLTKGEGFCAVDGAAMVHAA